MIANVAPKPTYPSKEGHQKVAEWTNVLKNYVIKNNNRNETHGTTDERYLITAAIILAYPNVGYKIAANEAGFKDHKTFNSELANKHIQNLMQHGCLTPMMHNMVSKN